MVLRHAPLGEINLPFVLPSQTKFDVRSAKVNRHQAESRDKLA